MPSEWESFLRAVPFTQGSPIADASVHVGFNRAARSVDSELSLTRRVGRVRLLASGRTFSLAFDEDRRRRAVAGGVVLQVTRQVAVAVDAATLLDREQSERVGWSAGAQLGGPSTRPLLLSAHDQSHDQDAGGRVPRRCEGLPGFECTVSISFARRAASRTPPPPGNDAGSNSPSDLHQAAAPAVVVIR